MSTGCGPGAAVRGPARSLRAADERVARGGAAIDAARRGAAPDREARVLADEARPRDEDPQDRSGAHVALERAEAQALARRRAHRRRRRARATAAATGDRHPCAAGRLDGQQRDAHAPAQDPPDEAHDRERAQQRPPRGRRRERRRRRVDLVVVGRRRAAGSAGWSVRPSPSLSAPSEHCGAGGGATNGSVSSLSCADWQPGSLGKSVLPSLSLSAASEHCAAGASRRVGLVVVERGHAAGVGGEVDLAVDVVVGLVVAQRRRWRWRVGLVVVERRLAAGVGGEVGLAVEVVVGEVAALRGGWRWRRWRSAVVAVGRWWWRWRRWRRWRWQVGLVVVERRLAAGVGGVVGLAVEVVVGGVVALRWRWRWRRWRRWRVGLVVVERRLAAGVVGVVDLAVEVVVGGVAALRWWRRWRVGSSLSSADWQPGSAGKSILPSRSLSAVSPHCGGGGGGASVSSLSSAETQPGSAGKSILPSRSLSIVSAHCCGGGVGSVSSLSVAETQPGSVGVVDLAVEVVVERVRALRRVDLAVVGERATAGVGGVVDLAVEVVVERVVALCGWSRRRRCGWRSRGRRGSRSCRRGRCRSCRRTDAPAVRPAPRQRRAWLRRAARTSGEAAPRSRCDRTLDDLPSNRWTLCWTPLLSAATSVAAARPPAVPTHPQCGSAQSCCQLAACPGRPDGAARARATAGRRCAGSGSCTGGCPWRARAPSPSPPRSGRSPP